MLEAVIKPKWPEDFRRIIDITYRFSWGWRRVHNPDTGHQVADNLTTTEFAIAMLAARDWTIGEIAAHMGVSASTVKRHLARVKEKLRLDSRQELSRHMLARRPAPCAMANRNGPGGPAHFFGPFPTLEMEFSRKRTAPLRFD